MILEQVRKNAVALISLFLAISSLAYTTWRNELTEHNRNIRFAGFEIILKVGELQRVVLHSHYGKKELLTQAREGWIAILQIEDLSLVMPKPMQTGAMKLKQVWQQHWETLPDNKASLDTINQAIDKLRKQTLTTLDALE